MAYCTKCGAQIPEDAAFCPVCGAPTSLQQQVTGVAAPAPDTPSIERHLVLAGWGSRILAWLIDVLILGVVLSPINWMGLHWMPYVPSWLPFMNFGLSNVLHLLYWTMMEGYAGQSVGKMALGLKVVNMQGGQLTIIDAGIESFGKAFLLPIDLIIGWILYPKTRQRLFSYLSRTLVIRK